MKQSFSGFAYLGTGKRLIKRRSKHNFRFHATWMVFCFRFHLNNLSWSYWLTFISLAQIFSCRTGAAFEDRAMLEFPINDAAKRSSESKRPLLLVSDLWWYVALAMPPFVTLDSKSIGQTEIISYQSVPLSWCWRAHVIIRLILSFFFSLKLVYT